VDEAGAHDGQARRHVRRALARAPDRAVPASRRRPRRGFQRRRLAELPLTVYRGAVATWYGPGFYGNTTACGIELTPDLVGVAHRSLPCGTNVAVRYGSRTLVLPVVDRGPFGSEARWDLTEAAAQQLGFTHTDRIGAVRVL
jgi:rare lipoprotein A (peptidoglycan hydrolase)